MRTFMGILKANEADAQDLQARITQEIMDTHSEVFPSVSQNNHFCQFRIGLDGKCFFILPNNRHRQYYTAAFEPGELKPDFIERDDPNYFTGGPI